MTEFFLKKKFNYFIISLITGILNFLVCLLRQKLGLPIFLDTVFVMAVLFLFGLWTSIGTMLIHYAITSFIDFFVYETIPYSLVYSLSGIAIIMITWLFLIRINNKKNSISLNALFLLYAILASALVSCVISGIINYILIVASNYNETWNGHYIVFSLMMNKKHLLPGLILGRIPITFIDRFVSTLLGLGIAGLYKLIKNKIQKREIEENEKN